MSNEKLREEIRKLASDGVLVFGEKEAVKLLKQGKVKQLFVSSNCAENIKQELDHFAVMGKVTLNQLDETNVDLGILCKKPFSISVICRLH